MQSTKTDKIIQVFPSAAEEILSRNIKVFALRLFKQVPPDFQDAAICSHLETLVTEIETSRHRFVLRPHAYHQGKLSSDTVLHSEKNKTSSDGILSSRVVEPSGGATVELHPSTLQEILQLENGSMVHTISAVSPPVSETSRTAACPSSTDIILPSENDQ